MNKKKMMIISSVLLQKVIYLLFRGHLPSLSTLDETTTSNTGRSTDSCLFGAAS